MRIHAIPFYGHTKPNGWMSNFYPCSIEFNGNKFSTSEQMFMWKKAMYFRDPTTANLILLAKTPAKAKTYGRQIINYDDEAWKNYRGIAMTSTVYEKFKQNEELRQLLIDTGDHFLIEATRNDKIWGIGLDVDDDRLYDTSNWQGLNLLGSCLMTVRKMLK